MPNHLLVVANVTINFQVYFLSLFEEFLHRAEVIVIAPGITCWQWQSQAESKPGLSESSALLGNTYTFREQHTLVCGRLPYVAG